MATYGRRRYLVAYDICDDGRLRRVHQSVKGFGRSLQYSVFVCDLSRTEKVQLRWELEELIDPGFDRVMFVDLGEAQAEGTSCFEFLGQASVLPSGGAEIV